MDEDSELYARKEFKTRPNMLKIVLFVSMYYPLSILLTFYQKWFIKNYHFPLIIVGGHYAMKYFLAIGFRFLSEIFWNRRIRISFQDQFTFLVPIGICASFDIGLSNWALEYVTVSLYTMAKSSSILFIVAFALLLRLERWRPTLGVAAGLIAVGLFLFTWKSAQLDLKGLLLIELAAACTGIRWTFSQLVMQKEDQGLRNPLDMVAHVQPWMFLAILPLIFFFEDFTPQTLLMYNKTYAPMKILVGIGVGGILAFCMEMSEYLLLVHTSGITLNIFGIIKEVITLLLAHYLNGDKLTGMNMVGLVLCFLGMILHAMSKNQKKQHKVTMMSPCDDRSILLRSDQSA